MIQHKHSVLNDSPLPRQQENSDSDVKADRGIQEVNDVVESGCQRLQNARHISMNPSARCYVCDNRDLTNKSGNRNQFAVSRFSTESRDVLYELLFQQGVPEADMDVHDGYPLKY